MPFPDDIIDVPPVESGADRFLSNMFGGTMSQEDGLNEMLGHLEDVEAYLQHMPRRNRVVNGDMRVVQRAVLGTTDDSYTLDGVILLLEAASGATVSQETSDVPTDGAKRALKLTLDGNDGKAGVVMPLEFLNCADLRGKTVSLQAKLKVNNARVGDVRIAVLEWTGTADSITSDVVGTWGSAGTNPTLATNWAYLGTPANLGVTTSWAPYRVEGLTVGASANNLAIFAWVDDESNDASDYLLITDVQLEEGAVCTEFERRPYQLELALCQRYYFEMQATGAAVIFGFGQATGTAGCVIYVGVPVTMRTTLPTLSVSDVSHFGPTNPSFTLLGAPSAIVLHSYNPKGGVAAVQLTGVSGAGLTAGHCTMLFSNVTGGANTRLMLSSEL